MSFLTYFIKRIPNMMVATIIATAFLVAIQYMYYSLSPRNWYYTYYEVIPTRAVVGEPIVFTSDREVNKGFLMNFNDELQCRVNGLYRNVGERPGKDFQAKPLERDTPEELQRKIEAQSGFTFDVYTPQEPMTDCRLETLVTMKLPFGIEKKQFLTSDDFDIVKEK